MERTKTVMLIINTIKSLRKDELKLFSEDSFKDHPGYLIDEFFQMKYIPFIYNLKRTIKSIPHDDYIIIELDKWIADIREGLNDIENSTEIKGFAELAYLKVRFFPDLINVLDDLKLERLEKEFNVDSDSSKTSQMVMADNSLKVLAPDGIALLISMLYNFNVLSHNLTIDKLSDLFAELTGQVKEDICSKLTLDKTTGRLISNTSAEQLAKVFKLTKSFNARIASMKGTD